MKAKIFSRLRIQDKIAFLSVIQFVIVIFLILIILNIFASRLISRDVKNNLLAVNESTNNQIKSYFESNIQLLQLVTSRTALRKKLAYYNETGDEDELLAITEIIEDAITPITQFERICILGLDGTVLTSTNGKYTGKDVADKVFFLNGLEKEGVYFFEEDGGYKIFISGPMILDDQLIGVGMTVLKLDGLEKIIHSRTSLGITGENLIAFYDELGQRKYPLERIFEEEALELQNENEETAYPMKQALSGNINYFENTLDYRNQEVVASSSFIEIANLGLVTKIDRNEVFEIKEQLLSLFILIFIIFFLFYYLFSQKVARFISKPILDLCYGTEEIKRGNFDYKIATQAQDEIGQLSRSFDVMVKSIKRSRDKIEEKVKKQTKEIEDNLNRFNALAKQSRTFIWEVDKKGMYIYASENVEDIIGYKVEELVHKKTVFDLHPEKGKEEFKKNVLQTIENGEKFDSLDNPIVNKKGDIVWVISSGIPILNNEEEVVGFKGSDIDITEKKLLEDKIKEREEQFELAVEGSNDGIWDWNLITNELYLSSQWKKQLGYDDEELENSFSTFENLLYIEDKEEVLNYAKRYIDGEVENYDVEFRMLHKDGNLRWIMARGAAVYNEDGKPYRLAGSHTDITDRKNFEIDLLKEKKELEKFQLAVQNASDHIVITDENGICLYMNNAAEKITGFRKEEILGKKVGTKENWGGLMGIENYKELWRTIKEDKKVFSGEISNKRKDGEVYTAKASISPITNMKGDVVFFVGIERDVTQENRVDQAKTEFVSLASHQLRTPLSTINWYTEMLLEGDAGEINAEQRKYLNEIYTGNQRMVELVNALLNVSRLELGTFTVELEDVDIVTLAVSAVNEVKPQIDEKNHLFEDFYQTGISKIKGDPKLLRIIFQNLLSNAIKYTPEKGKIKLEIRMVQQGEKIGGKEMNKEGLLISVSDNGYGIPYSQHDKIFSKLFRAENILEKDAEGTGLGLYILKSIVEHSEGVVWFESEENKGTTFYVVFPSSGMKEKKGAKPLN